MNKKKFEANITSIKVQLYKTAFLYLNNKTDALDIVDESIFKAYKSLKSLKHEEYFKTWITRILINECLQELKRKKKVTVYNNTDILDCNPLDSEMDCIQETLDSLSIENAIQKLPSNLKNIIILRFFTDLKLSEISIVLDIPQGTVVTWLRKALKLLKIDLLEEKYNE